MRILLNFLWIIYGIWRKYEAYLDHLDQVLQKCDEKNLILNFRKCHFMVDYGIVLNHVISGKDIEVDKVKNEIMTRLSYSIGVKGVRSFLEHDFYRIFIQNFSKIIFPLNTSHFIHSNH